MVGRVIYGASTVGEVIYNICKSTGIDVLCFCDDNKNKIGNKLCDVDIMSIQNVIQLYGHDIEFILATADIIDVINKLKFHGIDKWVTAQNIIGESDLSLIPINKTYEFVEFAVNACIISQNGYLTPDKVFLRSVDIIITERCTLKCKNCSNLMQYYVNPTDIDTNNILESVRLLCKNTDEIHEVRIIGGEPFINKNLHIIVNNVIQEDKIKKIVIYTNGTIIPNELQLKSLKNDKIVVLITDYGISKKTQLLVDLLNKENVVNVCNKAGGWTDCSDIKRNNRSNDELIVMFNSCCAKNTFSLINNKIYRCPFSANLHMLHAIEEESNDYILLSDDNTVKETLKYFISNTTFLQSCDYCNGRSFDSTVIEPGIQIKRPIYYKRF